MECDEANGWVLRDFYDDGSNMCVCTATDGNVCWEEDIQLM
jgi:hypothetical protein